MSPPMSLHPSKPTPLYAARAPSRIGRLPSWQRWATHSILTLCAASGVGYFMMREQGFAFGGLAPHAVLVWHGVSSAFALLAFGAVLPGHVRAAWNGRRHRISGSLMLAVMALLMLSGLLLYYGDEEGRDLTLWLHWGAGFAAVAVFALHVAVAVLGRHRR